MLTLLPDQGEPGELRPDAGRRVLRGNATLGIGKAPVLVGMMVTPEEWQA